MKRTRWNPRILFNLRIGSRHVFIGTRFFHLRGEWYIYPYLWVERNRYWRNLLFFYAPWIQLCQIGPYETENKYRHRKIGYLWS